MGRNSSWHYVQQLHTCLDCHGRESAAESAAARKDKKYADLSRRYEFKPVAFETHGSFCKKTADFISELGQRMSVSTTEKMETCFFFQRDRDFL